MAYLGGFSNSSGKRNATSAPINKINARGSSNMSKPVDSDHKRGKEAPVSFTKKRSVC